VEVDAADAAEVGGARGAEWWEARARAAERRTLLVVALGVYVACVAFLGGRHSASAAGFGVNLRRGLQQQCSAPCVLPSQDNLGLLCGTAAAAAPEPEPEPSPLGAAPEPEPSPAGVASSSAQEDAIAILILLILLGGIPTVIAVSMTCAPPRLSQCSINTPTPPPTGYPSFRRQCAELVALTSCRPLRVPARVDRLLLHEAAMMYRDVIATWMISSPAPGGRDFADASLDRRLTKRCVGRRRSDTLCAELAISMWSPYRTCTAYARRGTPLPSV
jgi:hypothetical protein